MRSDVATTPGWYGKLPTLGDFASRRLQDDFVEPWDLWLAGALQAQRAALGDAWLETFRQSPAWRFLLTPGVIRGAAAGVVFAGVLVPSADRVGRHFPLTLAASLPAVPMAAADVEALLGWLHRLEDTALDAVQSGWSIDELEAALATLRPPGTGAASADDGRLAAIRRALAAAQAGGGGFVDLGSGTSRSDLAGVFAGALGATPAAPAWTSKSHLDRVAVFIADVPGRPQLLVSVGLPCHDDVARMFGGGGGVGGGSSAIAGTAGGMTGGATGATLASTTGVVIGSDFDSDFGVVAADPLRLAPVTAAAAPATATAAAAGNDVLALFDSEATLPPGQLAALAASASASAPGDDIFALLNAGAAPVAAAAAAAPPAPDDILALFAVPADGAAAELPPAEPGEPDILDLFGGPAVEPGSGKP